MAYLNQSGNPFRLKMSDNFIRLKIVSYIHGTFGTCLSTATFIRNVKRRLPSVGKKGKVKFEIEILRRIIDVCLLVGCIRPDTFALVNVVEIKFLIYLRMNTVKLCGCRQINGVKEYH